MRRSPLLWIVSVLLCAALPACAEEAPAKKRSWDDDEAVDKTSEVRASASASSSASAFERPTIEQVLVEFSKKHSVEFTGAKASVPSLKCVHMSADGATITKGALIDALAALGFELDVSEHRIRIRKQALELPPCDAPEQLGYRVAQGIVYTSEPSETPVASGSVEPAPPASVAAKPPASSAPVSTKAEEAFSSIKRRSASSFELSRMDADRILPIAARAVGRDRANLPGVLVPHLEPGSLAERLGLRENDVVLSVNGFAVKSPSDMIDAYTRLRKAAIVILKLRRDGREGEIQYRIVN